MGLKIYSITNKINNKKYIGVTKDLDTRKRKHFWELKNNRHSNEKLQRDYNVFGASAFEVEILEELKYATKKEGFKKEVFYIGKYNSCDDGYNMSYGADGSNLSQITDDTREKHRQEMLGNTYWLGRKHTEETKKKIGDVHRGKTVKASTRKKLSEKAKEKTGEKIHFMANSTQMERSKNLGKHEVKNVDVLRQVLSITLSKNVLKKWGFRKLELILIKFV